MSYDDDGFMAGVGARSAKFEKVGDTYEGEIRAVQKMAVTDMTTGKAKFFPDGSPIFQWVFTIETERCDDGEDDGQRRIYAKNKLLKAIQAAVSGGTLPPGTVPVKAIG